MKLTIRKQAFQTELALALGVVESKITIPMLANVMLRAGKSGLEIQGTDLDTGILTRCQADVSRAGSLAVPARKLFDVVRAVDAETLSLETDESGWLRLDAGSFRGRLVGMATDDFPLVPELPRDSSSIALSLVTFQQMVDRVLFAVSQENTRFSINGALLVLKGGQLSLVATDGHRLAIVSKSMGSSGGPEVNTLVGRKLMAEIARMNAVDDSDEVEISTTPQHVFLRSRDRLIHARVLEGSFPNYEKVIPTDNGTLVKVPRALLASVLSRVALLTSDGARLVQVHASGSTLQFSTSSAAMGEATEDVPAECTGEEVRIGLNCDYVLQFLQAASGEQVEIRLKNSSTQALFSVAADGPWEYRYVVMPMRLT